MIHNAIMITNDVENPFYPLLGFFVLLKTLVFFPIKQSTIFCFSGLASHR
jgi:hypothetical protein